MREFWNQRYSEKEYAYGTRRIPGSAIIFGENHLDASFYRARAKAATQCMPHAQAGQSPLGITPKRDATKPSR